MAFCAGFSIGTSDCEDRQEGVFQREIERIVLDHRVEGEIALS